ncbi:hypothetical protein OIE62_05570 [Streptomyces scopuliridis]|uniref:Uncharacterized protein n=1 Tax=Streptomyces scopuliridis TaxID=452529 RepID=A0ACD4ZYR9_9ACTN|nr:hypothetical protein [Streptomyces scopuliridis]WSB38989.1 hypothetical protein OG949_33700 [Streptomyces scopuliridis]WSC03438.1 hypothetical protein OG835_36260 [Streptomyces scopuliridis]WSC11267.1 hypothetical protein OIE62_05570 [Streptomyces scopuliridis]
MGVPIGDPGALPVVLASALLAPVCALAGLALGAVIRHTAATMTATVAVLVLLPLVLTDGRHWSAVLDHAMPYQAWIRLSARPLADPLPVDDLRSVDRLRGVGTGRGRTGCRRRAPARPVTAADAGPLLTLEASCHPAAA